MNVVSIVEKKCKVRYFYSLNNVKLDGIEKVIINFSVGCRFNLCMVCIKNEFL